MDNGPVTLAETDVHVWKLPLDGLPPGAARAACRRLLLTLLGRYLGVGPDDVRIALGDHGKPALDPAVHEEDIQLNLSHSGDIALIVLAKGRRVGIDVQRMDERPGLSTLLRRASVIALPEERDTAALYAGWVRTEAAVKAVGGSFATMARSVGASADPRVPTQTVRLESASWLVQDLDVGAGYAAALCYERPPASVLFWEAQPPGRGWGPDGATCRE